MFLIKNFKVSTQENIKWLIEVLKEANQFLLNDKMKNFVATQSKSGFDYGRYTMGDYGIYLLGSYVKLAENVLLAADDFFTLSTVRTLLDLGFKRIDIFFAPDTKDTKKLGLILTLLDLSLLVVDKKHQSSFLQLLESEKHQLSKKAERIFTALADHVRDNRSIFDPNFRKDLAVAHQYRNDLLKKYGVELNEDLMSKNDFQIYYSIWSEALHGNPVALKLFEGKNPEACRHLLWITGQNVLSRIKGRISDRELSKKINDILAKHYLVDSA